MFSKFTWNQDYTSLIIFTLVGLTPLIYIESLYDKAALPRFAFITFLILPGLLLLILNKLKSPFFNWHPNILFFLLLIFYSTISFIWGGSYGYYEEQLINLLSFSFIFLIGTQSTNLKQLQAIIFIAIFSASIVSLIGILQKFYFNPFDLVQYGTTGSTFINKNYASNYIELIYPLNFILLVSSNSKQKVWLLTASLCLMLSYILIIHSRGAWLALIVFFIILLASSRQFNYVKQKLTSFSKENKYPLIILFFVPILIFLLPGKALNLNDDSKRYMATTLQQSQYSQTTITARKNAYLTAFDMINDKPILGVGLGNFHINFLTYARAANSDHKVFVNFVYLHNDILQTFVELGVIGGGILLFIIGNTLFFTIRFLKNNTGICDSTTEQITTKLLALGLLLALISSITHGLVSFPLHQATSGLIFYLWFGLLIGLLSKQIKITKATNILYKIIFTVSFVFMIYAFNHYTNQIKSNYFINKAMLAFNDKDCSLAINYVDKSMNYYAKDYYPQSWAMSIYGSCEPIEDTKKLHMVEKILSNNPLHPWALKMASLLYFKQGNYKYSEQALRLIATLYPSIPATYIELGNVLYKQKNTLKLITSISKH